jgi:hypothetical protein
MKAMKFFIIGMISLSTILVSCADDLVVPKYEEDKQNPDKPVGGEEPK